MTDPDAPPTVTENETENITEIVDPSIENASREFDHALDDDDANWIETVLTSLNQRSDKVKKALAKAMVDGQPCGNPAGLTTV